MPDLTSALLRLEGVAHLQDLLAEEFSRHQVAALLHQGRLVRPRIGWYAAPWHDPETIRAIRVGGRLTCTSAARSYGLPVPSDGRVHVALADNASRLRAAADGRRVSAGEDRAVVWHWSDAPGRYRVDPTECLRAASACVPARWFVGMVDSARQRGLLPEERLVALRAELSREKRLLLDRSDPAAESILESLLRVGLEDARLFPETQVRIGGFRVDFLLHGWLVIECDGAEHHAGRDEFESDRRRDSFLNRSGYRVLRFSYRQVVDGWADVLATIRAVLYAGPGVARIRTDGRSAGVSS
ncbi:endonuclease domain-containing protein [Naasia sp. SYSU D00948]|uniref:endonuclease domain-containing protein n=1 Tax=Naasia sp. SYSU D00948 TaxID=2817379 RepID=UPI001B30C4A0|nr:DUF559 domain-containing protein [Naasia sp. SYSU D00948]